MIPSVIQKHILVLFEMKAANVLFAKTCFDLQQMSQLSYMEARTSFFAHNYANKYYIVRSQKHLFAQYNYPLYTFFATFVGLYTLCQNTCLVAKILLS